MPIDRNNAQYITGAIYKPTQTSAPGVWDLDDQANNIAKNLWPLPPQAVQRSLRFNVADNAYLSRTPTVASNRKTWTWSGWVKRGLLGGVRTLFSSNGTNDSTLFGFELNGDALRLAGSVTQWAVTTPLYRDPSAWYHIVLATDTTQATASDRFKIYVNGVLVTAYSATSYPSQNADLGINDTRAQYIGEYWNATPSFDGYMAEINFVDGQALTPASFGEIDVQTGVWIPKRYTGTYGTNGFRLSFANNSSTTALGYDSSGQGNNWTTNNFSVTPGAGNDVLLDVPNLYNTDTGLGGEVIGNYCMLNPLDNGGITLSNGNLDATRSTATTAATRCTFAVSSGKWYWEVTPTALGALTVGIGTQSASLSGIVGGDAFGYGWYNDSGGTSSKYNSNVSSSYGTVLSAGVTCGVALDLDAGTITFYRNGISQGVAYSGITAGTYFPMISQWGGTTSTANLNFGQRPFAYPAPTGFKALCTTNLPAPAIGQTSSNQADNHFNVVTYTGNGGTQTISTLDFQPDLVWIKNRTGANSHILVDSIRGVGKGISSEAATGEYSIPTDFQSFNSNGFTVGYGGTNITNASANNYVAWSWRAATTTVVNTTGTITTNVRANQTSRFSIVRYTGNNGSSQTIGHGLNAIPDMIIVKNLDSTNANWVVYHKSLGSSSNLLLLNTTGTVLNIANYWGSNLPTNSVFGVGDGGGWDNNTNTHRHIAYCWAEVPGYSAFGSYTGNGSSDGPFVYLGFRPRWIMVKQSAGTSAASGSWQIFDTARDLYNPSDYRLQANSSGIEGTGAPSWDVLSNGFKLRSSNTNWNETSGTYVYAAFAETPARLSTAR